MCIRDRRIALLDWVKAAAIVNMVAYHVLYDAAFLFGAAGVQAFMRSAPAHWWERCICSAFILVSGALALHSRRPYRRALAVFGAGLLKMCIRDRYYVDDFFVNEVEAQLLLGLPAAAVPDGWPHPVKAPTKNPGLPCRQTAGCFPCNDKS